MNHPHDDATDAFLRKQFDGPVADNGFSERVMQQLPPRRRRTVWPPWVGILAGAGACWLSLLTTPFLHAGWKGWMSGELSISAIALISAIAGMSLLACWWSTMEAEDY